MSNPPKDRIEDAEIVSEEAGASSVEARPDEDVTEAPEGAGGASEAEAVPGGGDAGGSVPPVPAAHPAPEPERRGDSVPLLMALLGGVLAAGLGWLVATYMGAGPEIDVEAALAERDAEIADLRASIERVGAIETRLSELPEPPADRGPEIDTLAERLAAIESRPEGEGPDLTPIEQALVAAAEADEALAARVDEIAAAMPNGPEAAMERIDALEARIDSLSTEDVAGAGVEPEAVAALRTALQEARAAQSDIAARVEATEAAIADLPEDPGARIDAIAADIETLRADLAALEEGVPAQLEEAAGALRADLEALQGEITSREEALEIERQRLEEEAVAAAARQASAAAIASVRASIDTGEAYADAAATLAEQGIELPPVLARNADGGVPTLAALQQEFPDLARATIAAAPAPEGATGFLSRQLGVRSLEARDGDDADAVLSRAEAALRSGDLEGALSEIEGLDAPLREPLAEWTEAARLRAEAVSAAATLDAQ